MAELNVYLTRGVSTAVTVDDFDGDPETLTYDDVWEAIADRDDMPGEPTIGAFGQASVDADGEWEIHSVELDGTVVPQLEDQTSSGIAEAALRARIAELEAKLARLKELARTLAAGAKSRGLVVDAELEKLVR